MFDQTLDCSQENLVTACASLEGVSMCLPCLGGCATENGGEAEGGTCSRRVCLHDRGLGTDKLCRTTGWWVWALSLYLGSQRGLSPLPAVLKAFEEHGNLHGAGF